MKEFAQKRCRIEEISDYQNEIRSSLNHSFFCRSSSRRRSDLRCSRTVGKVKSIERGYKKSALKLVTATGELRYYAHYEI